MNKMKRCAFWAFLGAASFGSAMAQETVPMGGVKDAMAEEKVAPSDIPNSAPEVSDIDRLFDDVHAAEAEAAKKNADTQASALEKSATSPLTQAVSLDASDLISVDYPNEEIRTVLRNVADLYSINLVVPDTLQGTTSIKLRDVTWRQIYSVVLDPVGYTFIEDGSIIKIVSKETLDYEPPVTEIFMINYAAAENISSTVKNMIDTTKGGGIQVDKRTNALIVSERSSRMEDIRKVIERLDRPTEQIFIETRFIEVTDSDIKNIGVNWSGLRGVGLSAGPITHEYLRDSGNNSNRSNESESNTGEALYLNDGKLTGTGAFNGTVNSNVDGVVSNSTFGATASNSRLGSAFESLRSIADARRTSAVFSAAQFGIVLSALKEQGGSRLVSNPTVVTLNNQEAVISVGEKYPIPNYQYNEQTGGLQVNGFDYMDIGIILKVTPSVNSAGLISLKVAPEVSSRTASVSFEGSGSSPIPIVSTRRTVTQIALKDGYTMGIGGLMQSRGVNNGNSVPVLGKIPGFGRLFKHESKEEVKTNLLIFITARILPSETADFEDVFSQDMMQSVDVDPVTLKNR